MKQIVIDTDCGVDDAVAIAMAVAHPQLEVVALSTVNGNVGVTQVTENVLRLLPVLGRAEIPVYRGASRPLIARPQHAVEVHGGNGLGDVELPEAGKRLERAGAPDGLLDLARQNPGLTLVALGPLTNLAIAFNLYPELEDLLGGIVSMGGAVQRGNVTPYAEFNYYVDPEAVQAVLASSVPLTVVPWDAALKMAHTEEEIRRLGLADGRIGSLLLDMHRPLFSHIEKVFGAAMAMFPDCLAMAYVADPELAGERVRVNMKIEHTDSTRRGASVLEDGDRVTLIMEIDKAGFQRLLLGIRDLA